MALGLMVVLLTACGSLVPQAPVSTSGPTVAQSELEIKGTVHPARWGVPTGDTRALVVLAHGYTRRCDHLRGTSRQLVAAGLMTLCLDVSMAGGGDAALAEALADRLLDGNDPAGRPWPRRLIVAGHSAGAVFALRLGTRLAARTSDRLMGALLFDPVATPDFGTLLAQVADQGHRPVLALLAAPHRCNAHGNAVPALNEARRGALAAGRDTLQAVALGPGSTHADVEGEDSDWLAITVCGRPAPQQMAALRTLAVDWARARADGNPPLPAKGPLAGAPARAPVPWPAPAARHATITPCPTCVN